MTEHKWFLCKMCGPTVLCKTCGNNACNGGSGTLPNGESCPDCDSAYKQVEDFFKTDMGKFFAECLKHESDKYFNAWKYSDSMEFYLHQNHPEILEKIHDEFKSIRSSGSLRSYPIPGQEPGLFEF